MSKCFLDTTVVTDALLKDAAIRRTTRRALEKFGEIEVPMYAIKEFKAGPLKNFAWMYNNLLQRQSWTHALNALQRMSRTPRRYTTATAIEALRAAADAIGRKTPADLLARYGNKPMDWVLAEEFRLHIKARIRRAWGQRQSLGKSVLPLSCYNEVAPTENDRGMLECRPTKCDREPTCCLAGRLAEQRTALEKMRDAIAREPKRPELTRRSETIRKLIVRPNRGIDDGACRDLGDAVFAFFAPKDATVLTTNLKDHKPLAVALGKTVMTPDEVNSQPGSAGSA